MSQHPLGVFKSIDPELFKRLDKACEFALAAGALPKNFEFLIAITLDTAAGTVEGVQSLANAAIIASVTKEEIAEIFRIAKYISGVGTIYTAR
ncbi:carboxymuconolactone decarboxylase family protein [Chloroflexota bacterium]